MYIGRLHERRGYRSIHNGDKYVGQFKDGYMNGGTMTFSTGEVVENYYDEQYE